MVVSASSSTPNHTVVVLGASFVGVPMAHHLLKHTPPNIALRVILVAPNDAFYWVPATPRGMLPSEDGKDDPKGNPGFTDDKLFYPLAPSFAKYGDRFEHLLGRAQRLDPDSQNIEVSLLGDPAVTKQIRYDTVLVATGSDFRNNMPFKIVPNGGTAETKAALAEYRVRVRMARSIVVAGGGMTGVELAGELGYAYGKSKQKDIVLIVNDSQPMGGYGIKDGVRQYTAKELAKLGVRVLTNTRVAKAEPAAGDGSKTMLTLTNTANEAKTTTLEADLYIPAFGVVTNSQFLPEKLLDTSPAGARRVRTRLTLQAEGYDNVFVAGDVCNLQMQTIKNADEQIQVLSVQMQTYLQNWLAKQKKDAAQQPQELKTFAPSTTLMVGYSLGPGGGSGQVGSFKLLSFLIWFLKARFLGTQYAADIASGSRTMGNTKW